MTTGRINQVAILSASQVGAPGSLRGLSALKHLGHAHHPSSLILLAHDVSVELV